MGTADMSKMDYPDPDEKSWVSPNQFTGMRTSTLEAKLKKLEATLEKIDSGEAEGGGGSPREGLLEQIEDIEAELHRRLVEIS